MLRNNPATYYTGPQDYAAIDSGDHVAQPASSEPEVSYLDYAHQRLPAASIQQHSAHHNINPSPRPAPSMTDNTPSSHQRFHPYQRQSRSTTARDQQNRSLAGVVDSVSSSPSSAHWATPHISYPKISPLFPPTSHALNQSSYNLSTNYCLAGPSSASYLAHQHVPSRIKSYPIPSSTSVHHSLSHPTVPNTHTSEITSALIPQSPMVNSAIPYSSFTDYVPALPSDHWECIPGHANQPSATAPGGCVWPNSSYPPAINTLYSSFVAPNMPQLNDTFHPRVNMPINGGQGNTIFGNQENNVYHQIDDPINDLWNEIANVGARHDSRVRFPPPRCHEGTRTKIQKSILDWAQGNDPWIRPLCWLSGPAGAGKSAIAQTIAETTNEGSLITSFFFWRGDPQRNNPSKLFLVIAHGLALKFPELRCHIGEAIKQTPSILQASIDIQLEKLIIKPLSQSTTINLDGLIIIDALDECSGEKEQRHVLHLLGSIFSEVKGRLPHILICSRPEQAIQEMLNDLGVHRLKLEDNCNSEEDIEKYLHAEFDRIRNCDRCKSVDFPTPWPSPSQIHDVLWHTSGQFIYATTIISFIDGSSNPCEQLEKVVGQWRNEDAGLPSAPLDALYHRNLSPYPQGKQKQLQDALRFVIYFEYAKGCHMEPDVSRMDLLLSEAKQRADSVIKGVEHGNLEEIHKFFRDSLDKRLPEGIIRHSLEARNRDRRAKNENVEKLEGPTNKILKALNTLSEAHKIAWAASIIVSGIWRVVKVQHEQDKAIVALYDVMIETYEIAIDKKALNQDGDFSELFEKIVRQSEEYYVFLSKYMFQGCLRQVVEFWEIPSKTSELTEAFERLQVRFSKAQVSVTTVAVLDKRRTLGSPQRKDTLQILKPSRNILRPKSHCMLGTRQVSIGKILDWAFHGGQSVLWISGIAGCGKSSLIGTLHDTLSTFGFNSRLAAFIRFDRSEYNDAGEFVKALAFLLANFDERFGKPIAEAVERSHQIEV
ncbi:hypothetical protein VNI00_015182 [Paramarasmius palmivorus]|uniref:Nephrocystin 3-like N-terminal domain-containing protein n=1 Tax=Paramarasmius palmivorus TaxID=297713 RepID=A0AAW0BM96_9AGAR